MPNCLNCGNLESFSTTNSIENSSPETASLIANFDTEGFIASMESQGFTLDQAQEAWEYPARNFTYCCSCGSDKIQW